MSTSFPHPDFHHKHLSFTVFACDAVPSCNPSYFFLCLVFIIFQLLLSHMNEHFQWYSSLVVSGVNFKLKIYLKKIASKFVFHNILQYMLIVRYRIS